MVYIKAVPGARARGLYGWSHGHDLMLTNWCPSENTVFQHLLLFFCLDPFSTELNQLGPRPSPTLADTYRGLRAFLYIWTAPQARLLLGLLLKPFL